MSENRPNPRSSQQREWPLARLPGTASPHNGQYPGPGGFGTIGEAGPSTEVAVDGPDPALHTRGGGGLLSRLASPSRAPRRSASSSDNQDHRRRRHHHHRHHHHHHHHPKKSRAPGEQKPPRRRRQSWDAEMAAASEAAVTLSPPPPPPLPPPPLHALDLASGHPFGLEHNIMTTTSRSRPARRQRSWEAPLHPPSPPLPPPPYAPVSTTAASHHPSGDLRILTRQFGDARPVPRAATSPSPSSRRPPASTHTHTDRRRRRPSSGSARGPGRGRSKSDDDGSLSPRPWSPPDYDGLDEDELLMRIYQEERYLDPVLSLVVDGEDTNE